MTDYIVELYSGAGESTSFFSIGMMILGVAGMWKMFEKAGEPGWAALIPFYNIYKLCQISIGNGWMVLLALFIPVPILGLITLAVLLYLLAVNTAAAFGKPKIWAVGLFFLSSIFYCILGFGDAEYYGPQGIGDNRSDEDREAKTVDFEVINHNHNDTFEEVEDIDVDKTE
ncbi:MAG TPA: hypothetical protein GX736_05620 [Mogibacterium sp.]|nr:hypothetical protein [Mogibacterium sp.]